MKNALVVVLVLFFGFQASSQFAIGGKAGVNIASMDGSSVRNGSSITGYNVGLVGEYCLEDVITTDIGQNFFLHAELFVETKGVKGDYDFDTDPTVAATNIITDTGIVQNMTYVSIPVMLKFAFGKKDALQFYVGAGAFGSSLWQVKIDGEIDRDHDKKPNSDPRKFRQEYTGFDMGLLGGLGCQFPVADNFMMFIDARYAYGMRNLGEYRNAEDIPEYMLEDLSSRTISGSVGVVYKFDIW